MRSDTLDLVQIYNATLDCLEGGEITQYLIEAQEQGIVKHLNISVYCEEPAVASIDSGIYKTVQIAYNLIDRTMKKTV